MLHTKEIFDLLSKGGFICQNSVSPQKSHLYDDIEDNFDEYRRYFEGIGFILEGGNGYFYFTRTETRTALDDKIQRLSEWIDRIDFLKVFNSTFGPGFTFRKSNILEQFSNDVELKEKAVGLYPELKNQEEKVDKLLSDMEKMGFIELENEYDSLYRVTSAFHYIEEMMDCITIIETEEDTE